MEKNLTQNTPQNSVQQEFVPPSKPANKSFPLKWLSLGIGLILILILLAGTYFLGKNTASKTSTNQEQTTNAPTPTPTLDPTASWKTYNNNKYSYTLKYPETWTIDINNQTPEYLTIRSNTTYPQSPGDVEPIMYWINLTYVQNPNNNSFKDLVTKDLPQNLKDNFTYSTEKINSITAYRTTSLPSQSGCEWIYFLKPDNNYISVNFCVYDKNKPFIHQQENYDLFNKMITTFKFTDQTSPAPDETLDWNLYKDANYPFQIKYPNHWNLRTTYGKSVNNLNNHRIAGIDISDDLTYGSTIVANVMSYNGEDFQEWIKLYSGHGNELSQTNFIYQGYPAYRFTYPNGSGPAGVEVYYRYKDKVIFIAWHTPTAYQQPLVDKILSTLQFNP